MKDEFYTAMKMPQPSVVGGVIVFFFFLNVLLNLIRKAT